MITLRCRTWLSPGLPIELFEAITRELGRATGFVTELSSDESSSGPAPGYDPFATGDVELGFVCTPSYRALAGWRPPSVRLAGAAPVFADARNEGRPVYFSELVVRADSRARSLSDLSGARFGYNDPASQSGYRSVVARLTALLLDEGHLGELVCTGGHRRSLELLLDGTIDAAAIDSNTLLGMGGPPAGLRVAETWGPYPVQPVVVAASLDADVAAQIGTALLAIEPAPLRPFAVERFAVVTEEDYR